MDIIVLECGQDLLAAVGFIFSVSRLFFIDLISFVFFFFINMVPILYIPTTTNIATHQIQPFESSLKLEIYPE